MTVELTAIRKNYSDKTRNEFKHNNRLLLSTVIECHSSRTAVSWFRTRNLRYAENVARKPTVPNCQSCVDLWYVRS